jgi:integrase
MASIKAYTLKNGELRYEYFVSNGRNPGTGKQNRIHKSGFLSHDEAVTAAKIVEGELAAGKYKQKNPKKLTINQFFETWLTHFRTNVKQGTVLQNKANYNAYIKDRIGNYQLHKYKLADHQKFINELYTEKDLGRSGNGLSLNTIRAVNATLHIAFEGAIDQGIIDENPCKRVRFPRTVEKADKFEYYTFEQSEAFLEQAKKEKDPMWYPYFLLLLDQGPRKAEAAGLEWKDIDFANNTIHIRQIRLFAAEKYELADAVIVDEPKTKTSKRTLKMTNRTKLALLAYRNYLISKFGELPTTDSGQSFVFIQSVFMNAGLVMRGRTINTTCRRIQDKAGLPHIKVHDFRHTFAVRMRQANVPLEDIKDLLGHADVTVTQIYASISPEIKERALDQYEAYMDEQKKKHS